MSLHNFSDNTIFNNKVAIESQYVKAINFYTPLGRDFDFNSNNITFDYKYHILDNKNDKRRHIIILEFKILEKTVAKKKESECVMNIVLEGIYKINELVENESQFLEIKNFVSLNLMINFLRIALNNITSLTFNKDFFLPPINFTELHRNNYLDSQKKPKISAKK